MSTDVHHPNPFDAQDAAGFATICGWCPELHILKLARQEMDVIVAMQMGKDIQIQRNGQPLTISHGMCERCKEAQVATVSQDSMRLAGQARVSREAVAPVPAENAAETGAGSTKETKQTPAPAARLQWPDGTPLGTRELLERAVVMTESALQHIPVVTLVSPGGATRADAENWLRQAKAVLEQ
jgi:hypothetical protein